jgi:hypothetical protein
MALTTKKGATAKKVARPRAMPLAGPPSPLPDLDEGGDALPYLDISTIDPLEVLGLSDPEAWGSLPPAETKPSAALAKAPSKLGKKSTKLKGAAPWKLVRPRPRRDS